MYPTVEELIRQYMEDSVWELYKAHVIRDIKHFDGRVDPAKKCKYCLSCQLRLVDKSPNNFNNYSIFAFLYFDNMLSNSFQIFCAYMISYI